MRARASASKQRRKMIELSSPESDISSEEEIAKQKRKLLGSSKEFKRTPDIGGGGMYMHRVHVAIQIVCTL